MKKKTAKARKPGHSTHSKKERPTKYGVLGDYIKRSFEENIVAPKPYKPGQNKEDKEILLLGEDDAIEIFSTRLPTLKTIVKVSELVEAYIQLNHPPIPDIPKQDIDVRGLPTPAELINKFLSDIKLQPKEMVPIMIQDVNSMVLNGASSDAEKAREESALATKHFESLLDSLNRVIKKN